MVTELMPGIHAIDIPLPGNPLKNLNSFLLTGTSRNLLIDTGFNMAESLEAMRSGLSELDVDMARTDIFLTHLHSDHIGLSPAIADRESRVFINGDDLLLMKRFNTQEYRTEIDEFFIRLGFPRDELMENVTKNPAMIYLPTREIEYTVIEDGYILDLGNRKLQCIVTPGHTPGHTCLYDPEDRVLFAGDHIIFSISPNITSWTTVTDSLGSYLESLDRIGNLDIRRTFSAHRSIEGDCYVRIQELKDHHFRRIDEAFGIVTDLKKATVYEIASRMTWSIRAKDWSVFPVAQKWFAVGEAHSHLEYLRVRSRVKRTEENGFICYEPLQ